LRQLLLLRGEILLLHAQLLLLRDEGEVLGRDREDDRLPHPPQILTARPGEQLGLTERIDILPAVVERHAAREPAADRQGVLSLRARAEALRGGRARREVGKKGIPCRAHAERVQRQVVAREPHRAVLRQGDANGVGQRDRVAQHTCARGVLRRQRSRGHRQHHQERAAERSGHPDGVRRRAGGLDERHSYRSAWIGLRAAALRAG
jgi:hypothetical protein